METIRAINIIAKAEAVGVDGARTPGGASLHKRSKTMNDAVASAVILVRANEMQPEHDHATQIRLAAAVDRQIAGHTSEDKFTMSVTRAILNDFYLQEAAALRLAMAGERDPLAHLADPASQRSNDATLDILERNNIRADVILKTASKDDMIAIAGGRFDQIASEHTRFAVGTILRHAEHQMSAPTAAIPMAPPPAPALSGQRGFPSSGIGVDARPKTVHPTAFGRRASMEIG